jgi:hypothetical protein
MHGVAPHMCGQGTLAHCWTEGPGVAPPATLPIAYRDVRTLHPKLHVAHRHKLGGTTIGRPRDIHGVRRRDVVVRLQIASGAREVVQVPDFPLGARSLLVAQALEATAGELQRPRRDRR